MMPRFNYVLYFSILSILSSSKVLCHPHYDKLLHNIIDIDCNIMENIGLDVIHLKLLIKKAGC